MLIADIRGKLSLSQLISEDFLTSSVFSVFKYIEPIWLEKYLNIAINLNGNSPGLKIVNPVFEFWPWFPVTPPVRKAVEPDIIIYTGHTAIIIEAKNYSGKSGQGLIESTNIDKKENAAKELVDQLGKEYIVGCKQLLNRSYRPEEPSLKIDNLILIFLTRDQTMPTDQVTESLKSIIEIMPGIYGKAQNSIFWLNWQKSIPVLDEIMFSHKETSMQYKIVDDLMQFLKKRDLYCFSGFSFLDNYKIQGKVSSTEAFFYNKIYKKYWDYFKRNDVDLDVDVGFYEKEEMVYWQYLGDKSVDVNSGPIFYKGV